MQIQLFPIHNFILLLVMLQGEELLTISSVPNEFGAELEVSFNVIAASSIFGHNLAVSVVFGSI